MTTTVDTQALEEKVKAMYRDVAEEPAGDYHFETGRPLAERLGYTTDVLDRLPGGAVDSFAGVGYFHDLAAPTGGEVVVDLGSGSGMDVFYAAELVGPDGHVAGVDFTPEQLAKARRLAVEGGYGQVRFHDGRIEGTPLPDAGADCVISNGVINLSPDKALVFAEAARLLRPGGRLALADIVTQTPLTEAIVCNADLWASCIGGAALIDDYRAAIEGAGLRIEVVRDNAYGFTSAQAQDATVRYGVKSIELLAIKP